jgi:DNA-binding transcriptional MerR regulator/methylmalonyl-CoA mutase cobalamin-binding subunit
MEREKCVNPGQISRQLYTFCTNPFKIRHKPMNNQSQAAPDAGEKLYTIGTVSRLTGVPPITLRAWERRYKLLRPVRKQSGHRLYTRGHIDLINRITALTTQGIRISQIQPHMLATDVQADPSGAQSHNPWQQRLESLVAAIISFDEDRLEEIYNEALSLHPVELMTRKLLRPLLVELGLRWEVGKGSVAEEHFFAFYLRNKLGARYHHRSRKARGPKLLLAGLPGELHDIALLLFALAATEMGFQVTCLGTNMPLAELPGVAARTASDAVVLSGSVEPGKAIVGEALERLAANCQVPVFIGGQASVHACDAINRAGAIGLGNDLEAGLQRLAEKLDFAA